MSNFPYGSSSPKSFHKFPVNIRTDFDLESGGTSSSIRRPRKPKSLSPYPVIMLKKLANQIHYYYKFHPLFVFCISLSVGLTILIVLTLYESNYNVVLANYKRGGMGPNGDSQFGKLKNLVMVAGHSVYTSHSCGRADDEGSWFLESYQKHSGQAATFLDHIREGVEITGKDDEALLLFSGGETRKDAGPRSEAQSYWMVAEWKDWFGRQDTVRWRALTEEHARDSFENLLFSVCRFRELTGTYPQNITVVSYDFKEDRFAHLHRSALKFPEGRFFYSGTPASSTSKEAAIKGEALVKAQFQDDPYGCLGPLRRKKLGRDPFHRSIPYPNGCPEMKGLFRYCGAAPYPGYVPW